MSECSKCNLICPEKYANCPKYEELFGHAGSDWQHAHLLTDAEKAEDKQLEAAKKKAKAKK